MSLARNVPWSLNIAIGELGVREGRGGLEGLGFFCLPGLLFGGKNDLKKGINFCKCLFPFLFFIDLNNFLNKCFF